MYDPSNSFEVYMQKTLSIACAALFLSLTACQKGFDLDTPLHDKAKVQTAESVAYIKTGDFDLSKSLKNPLQVNLQGTTLTKWADQERYVYLSKPVAQDVTVTVAIVRCLPCWLPCRSRRLC